MIKRKGCQKRPGGKKRTRQIVNWKVRSPTASFGVGWGGRVWVNFKGRVRSMAQAFRKKKRGQRSEKKSRKSAATRWSWAQGVPLGDPLSISLKEDEKRFGANQNRKVNRARACRAEANDRGNVGKEGALPTSVEATSQGGMGKRNRARSESKSGRGSGSKIWTQSRPGGEKNYSCDIGASSGRSR